MCPYGSRCGPSPEMRSPLSEGLGSQTLTTIMRSILSKTLNIQFSSDSDPAWIQAHAASSQTRGFRISKCSPVGTVCLLGFSCWCFRQGTVLLPTSKGALLGHPSLMMMILCQSGLRTMMPHPRHLLPTVLREPGTCPRYLLLLKVCWIMLMTQPLVYMYYSHSTPSDQILVSGMTAPSKPPTCLRCTDILLMRLIASPPRRSI